MRWRSFGTWKCPAVIYAPYGAYLPGGSLWHSQANRRRARVVNGTIEHLAAPSYHGNPMDPNGSLAFFDYGWELLDWVREAGFRDVSVICYWSAALGHLGAGLEIFHAQR